MLEKLQHLLGRVATESAKIDRLNKIHGQPWVVATELGMHLELIFQGGGVVIVSRDGAVTRGHYEVLEMANSVLLEFGAGERMYTHDFIDGALMVLQVSGNKAEPMVLVNRVVVPDLDVPGYLERTYLGPQREAMKKEEVKALRRSVLLGTVNHKEVRVFGNENRETDTLIGLEVLLGAEPAPDDFYIYGDNRQALKTYLGKVTETYFVFSHHIEGKQFQLLTNRTNNGRAQFALLDGEPAPDGTYKTGWLRKVVVKDGKVV